MADNLLPSYSAGGKGRKTTPAGMVAHAYTPSQAKAEELLRVEASLSYLFCEFQASLSYSVRPCFIPPPKNQTKWKTAVS